MLCKDDPTEGSTYYAQGGVAAVLDEYDSVNSHIEDTLAAGAGLLAFPLARIGLAVAPNSKVQHASIGVGGMGAGNIQKCSGENIVALCDVDFKRGGETFEKHPKAKRFKDF